MKKTAIAIILALVALPLFAVNVSGLNANQKLEYYSNELTIQQKSVFSSEATFYHTYSSFYASETIEWTPYLGGYPISKADFFYLTGQEAIYQECLAIMKRNNRRIAWGTGLTVAGTIGCTVGYIGLLSLDLDDPDYDRKEAAYLWTEALSAIPLVIGCAEFYLLEDINVSASFAIGVADVYNTELLARVKISVK